MYYGNIKHVDVANGEGVRVSLFVSGCRLHCKGCFNKETWDFKYGKPFTKEVEDYIIDLLDKSYIQGLSVLGGEPFEEENQKVLYSFFEKVKARFHDKNIWCYTGYVYDKDLVKGGRKYTKYTDKMLSFIDKLVDGSFIESLKDVSLKYKGSSNQRIIPLKY